MFRHLSREEEKVCVWVIVGEEGGGGDIGPHYSLGLTQVVHTIQAQGANTGPGWAGK